MRIRDRLTWLARFLHAYARRITPDEIRDLPAAWYAMQPIPPRLLAALERPVDSWPVRKRSRLPRALGRDIAEPRAKLAAVEQAHVRATNRLLRSTKRPR